METKNRILLKLKTMMLRVTMDAWPKDPDPKNWRTIEGTHVHLKNGKIDGGAGGKFNGHYWTGKQKHNFMGPKIPAQMEGAPTNGWRTASVPKIVQKKAPVPSPQPITGVDPEDLEIFRDIALGMRKMWNQGRKDDAKNRGLVLYRRSIAPHIQNDEDRRVIKNAWVAFGKGQLDASDFDGLLDLVGLAPKATPKKQASQSMDDVIHKAVYEYYNDLSGNPDIDKKINKLRPAFENFLDSNKIPNKEMNVKILNTGLTSFISDRPFVHDTRETKGLKGLKNLLKAMKQKSYKTAQHAQITNMSDACANVIACSLSRGLNYKDVGTNNDKGENDAIAAIGGRDKTSGSCSSVALTFVARTYGGMDVVDYRGGESLKNFQQWAVLQDGIAKLKGVRHANSTTGCFPADIAKTLQSLPLDEQYYLAFGGHAAVVRNTSKGPQYLELQSYQSDNGWKDFGENLIDIVDKIEWRFNDLRNKKYYATIIPAKELGKSLEFREIMGYINNDPGKQIKGDGGGIK